MASLEFTCYEELKAIGRGVIPSVHGDELATDRLEIMGNSVQSEVFPPQTRYVVLIPEAECRIAIGEDPTAKNDFANGGATRRIFPGKEYIFRVAEGDCLAVIQLEP